MPRANIVNLPRTVATVIKYSAATLSLLRRQLRSSANIPRVALESEDGGTPKWKAEAITRAGLRAQESAEATDAAAHQGASYPAALWRQSQRS